MFYAAVIADEGGVAHLTMCLVEGTQVEDSSTSGSVLLSHEKANLPNPQNLPNPPSLYILTVLV